MQRYLGAAEVWPLESVFDRIHHIRSTANMPTWDTGKPCHFTNRSRVDMCVFDSTWEASEAYAFAPCEPLKSLASCACRLEPAPIGAHQVGAEGQPST